MTEHKARGMIVPVLKNTMVIEAGSELKFYKSNKRTFEESSADAVAVGASPTALPQAAVSVPKGARGGRGKGRGK